MAPAHKYVLIALCGAAMMLTQFVAVREIGSTFFSTELVTLAAVVIALVGPSIAYALSDRLGRKAMQLWALLSYALILAVPVAVRYLVAVMTEAGMEAWAMAATFVAGSLFLCGIFAVFLPRLAPTPGGFPQLYALEVGGALLALALIWLAPGWHVLLVAYWAICLAVLHLGLGNRWLSLAGLAAFMAGSVFYRPLDTLAAQTFYADYWDLEQPELIDSAYSMYQRIDVVRHRRGKSLFLDGVPYFSRGDLDWFNIFIAEVPGRLKPGRGDALVIGSGSFGSAGLIKRLGYKVTVVDIDAVVARLGFKDFGEVHLLQPGDVEVVIDDARSYLASHPHQSFDLIVMDVPAPFHLQTALLYTPAFYAQVRAALRPGGVASFNLCSYDLADGIASSIASSALTVFPSVTVVQSKSTGLSLMYAGSPLPFTARAASDLLRRFDPEGGQVFDDAKVRSVVGNTRPHTADNLAALLILARWQLPGFKQ